MIAIVLAGGYGTRLWPISYHRPKMLLPLGEGVVLDSVLEPLEREDRIRRVYVSTNQRFAGEIATYVEGAGYRKVEISEEPTSEEDEKLGAVGAIAALVDREDLSDDAVVVAGDHYIDFPLRRFVDRFESADTPAITARRVASKHEASSYGVIEVDEGRVVSFVEKPASPPSRLISPACYGFPAGTLAAVDEYLTTDRNPDAPGHFIDWLVARTDVRAHVVDGMVMDVGTRNNYIEAVDWALDGGCHVAPGATVENSSLEGGVLVLDGAEVRDSVLENSVVFPDASIERATLRRSVVDEASSLANVELSASLVGRWTELHADNTPPP